MSDSPPVTIVTLKVDTGTLYAIPDAGQVRVQAESIVLLNAAFPFFVEITRLTGNFQLPKSGAAAAATPPLTGFSFVIPLLSVPSADGAPPAPSFKYTVRGGAGAAAGRVLDPIIIVDKKF